MQVEMENGFHNSPLKARSRIEGRRASSSLAVSACRRFSASTSACNASNSATIRRWYTYAVQFFALATLLFGIRELVTSVVVRLVNLAPQSDSALPTIIAGLRRLCA